MDCFIGVDLGTSGCRAVAVDTAGRELATAAVALTAPRRGPDGRSEQDPALWWRAVLAVLGDLAPRLCPHRPRALALDATATTVVAVAPDGEPLCPAMMYDDARAITQAATVAASAPPDSPVHGASTSLSKLLFLAESLHPPAGSLALHQADWVLGRLSGRFGVSDWNNCLRLGYDPAREAWPDWLNGLDLGGLRLPVVVAPGHPVGVVDPAVAAATGLPAELMVHAGTTDSTAAVLAAGARRPGDGVTVLGSTLAVKLVCSHPVSAPAFGVYSHRLGDLWLAGGASNSGGAVLRGLLPDTDIAALSTQLRPDAPTGLDYYPLLHPGERFPVNDPRWPPRLSPRPEDDALFLQGLLEGMAAIEARGYTLLRELGAPPLRRVASIGGGAANEAWRRIRETALRIPVVRARRQQAAYGAACLARWGYRP
jgi:hypothetical protein